MHQKSPKILSNVLWTFAYICDWSDKDIGVAMGTGIHKIMIDKLVFENLEKNYDIIRPSVRAITSMLSGNDKQVDNLIKIGFFPKLEEFLKTKKPSIFKEVCWGFSNMAAGTRQQRNLLLSRKLINDSIVGCLAGKIHPKLEIQRECLWYLSNLFVKGNFNDFKLFHDNYGILDGIKNFMKYNDEGILEVCLEIVIHLLAIGDKENKGFASELEKRGYVDCLDDLRNRKNKKISNKADEILEKYYDKESDYAFMDDNSFLQQQVVPQQYNFEITTQNQQSQQQQQQVTFGGNFQQQPQQQVNYGQQQMYGQQQWAQQPQQQQQNVFSEDLDIEMGN